MRKVFVVLVAWAAVTTVGAARVPAAEGAAVNDHRLDCEDWRYGPSDERGPLPAEYDRDNYKRTSLRDPAFADSPQNLCGQKGAALDLAWGLSRGANDVRIAVLDSGVKWRDPGAMADLATTAYINLGEAQPPCWPAAASGDCDRDGDLDIADFGAIADRNGNGLADPEDLILDPARNNRVDDDHDGWVDDISGWDFLYGDNNPLDTVEYGHGTGEAQDSTAAENGAGDVGGCPQCRFIPVRVSDSFIADGGRFAAGVLFALDAGADVVQEALGTISNPRQAQQAIDVAYRRGVVVVASMADEASKHPNLPASLEHTMTVNSVTEKTNDLVGDDTVQGYLALNGCTNFGGRTFVSVPSGACSSEATGQSAGMVALLESYARQLGVAPNPALPSAPGTNVLTANEVMQIVRAAADDVDFSTPTAVDPPNNFGTSNGSPLLDTVRYPTTAGWDATFGYGRINAYEMMKAVRDRRIPPEAMIDGPSWFDVLPVSGQVAVTGRVAAARATAYDYRVEWAPGLQPPLYPATDRWRVAARRSGLTAPLSGRLATLDLARIAAALPGGGKGAPVDPATGRPDEERFSVRLRVVVTAHGGTGDGRLDKWSTAEMQKQIFVHQDPDQVAPLPQRVPGAGTSSPSFVDVNGDGRNELLLATDDGAIHAFIGPGRAELPGFPLHGDYSRWWNPRSPAARAAAIPPHRGAFGVGAPAVADLDGNGSNEVVASDMDDKVYVWSARGARRATMHVDPDFSRDDAAAQDSRNRTKPGFAAQPALGDLDGDGTLEIVAGALDRHLYAWHPDGTPVTGFPRLLVDPAKVDSVDPVTDKVTFKADSGVGEGGEIVAVPALADLTGDERPEIVIGVQEQYQEPMNVGDGAAVVSLLALAGEAGNSRLYAVSPEGTFLPGWPAKLPLLATELLPTIGGGVAMQAAIGDVVADHPGPEIVAATAAGPLMVLGVDGKGVYGSTAAGDLPLLWAGGLSLEDADQWGPNRTSNDLVASTVGFGGPSIGPLTRDGSLDIAANTSGLTRFIDLLASDLQLPNDDQLSGWDGDTRLPLPGSPQATSDLAFFVAPAIGDLDGDGDNEMVAGNGLYLVDAYDGAGHAAPGWPKLTGGWSVGTPGIGNWVGDGRLEVAQVTRDGRLYVWRAKGRTPAIWSRAGCDATNAGSCAG
jgi:hypothetical protein